MTVISRKTFRVLIVDDDVAMQRLMRQAMIQQGFACDTANDGVDADEQLAAGHYDAVVTDLVMPNKHGYALATQLLAQTPRPVIVVLTGVTEPRLADDLRGHGVDDVVYKPTNARALAVKVRELVERKSDKLTGWQGDKVTG